MALDDWFASASDAQKSQLAELRALVLDTVPYATEELKWGQPCYSRNGLFCYLQKSKGHVTLGFQKGAAMQDPRKLLEGAGSQMRHIKFRPGQAINDADCIALIEEAIRLDGAAG